MFGSIKYRIIRPLLIRPPYSKFLRKLASKFLNIAENYVPIEIDRYVEDKNIMLNDNGFFISDVDELNLRPIFNKLTDKISELGFPKSGKIDDIKNQELINFIKSKLNENSKKKFKISISDLVERKLLDQFKNIEIFKKISSNYLKVNTHNSYIDILFDHNMMNQEHPKESQLFHQDHNGILFLKIFIYLIDVDYKNGPYSYVKSTHNKKFMKSLKLKKNYINDNVRYNNEEVLKVVKNNIVTFNEKKGKIIFSDTTGLHRGTVPDKDYFRLLLSMTFEPKNSMLSFTK
jgi:hypothetical protein